MKVRYGVGDKGMVCDVVSCGLFSKVSGCILLYKKNCSFSFSPKGSYVSTMELQTITSELLELFFSTLEHTNRFVRETGFKLITTIIKISGWEMILSVRLGEAAAVTLRLMRVTSH